MVAVQKFLLACARSAMVSEAIMQNIGGPSCSPRAILGTAMKKELHRFNSEIDDDVIIVHEKVSHRMSLWQS